MRELTNFIGQSVGFVSGVALAPLAIALDCSVAMIEEAVKQGCQTEQEIRDFVLGRDQ